MFKKFRKYVSAVTASAVLLTSMFTTSLFSTYVTGDVLHISGTSEESFTGTVADDAVLVTAEASKTSLKEGDEFFVDFKIKNNPGFYGYGFTVKYTDGVIAPMSYNEDTDFVKIDELDANTAVKYTSKGKKEIAVSAWSSNAAAAKAANGSFGFADLINSGASAAEGDGVIFRVPFKAVGSGNASVTLGVNQGSFISTKAGTTIESYSQSADLSVIGDIKPVDQKVYHISGTTSEEFNGEVPAEAVVVEAVPSNAKPGVGQEFYVDFKIKNNPGFYGYGFTVEYDNNVVDVISYDENTDSDKIDALDADTAVKYTSKGKKEIAVSAWSSNAAAAKAANGSFGFADLINSGASSADGDGIIFRVPFTAKAAGSCNITLNINQGSFISTKAGTTIESYSKGGVVTIGAEEETTVTTTEDTTVTTTEDTTVTESETDSEATTEDEENSETTTKKTETDTETTTRRPSSSGGSSGGGSPKKDRPIKTPTTTDKTPDKTPDETPDKTPDKKPDKKPTTTSNKVSFVTKSGVTVNIPKADPSKTKSFKDVNALTPWASSYVNKLASAGIINGVSDTEFNPKGNTKRGDFMVIIAKLLGLEGTPSSNFSDVPKDKYYYNAIGLTKQIGIAAGVGADKFDPEASITREQVMAITARVLDLTDSLDPADLSVLDKFIDKADISNYAKSNIASLVSMKIVSGDTNGRINPRNNITRAETAVIMCGVYDVILANAEAINDAAEKATATTTEKDEDDTESTTSDETKAESESSDENEVSEAVADYRELLEYVAAFVDYAVDGNDDQAKILKDKYADDYQDEYDEVYSELEKYDDKYDGKSKIDLDKFVKDTKKVYDMIKELGDKVDLAVESTDSKKVIKDAKDEIDDSVKAIEKALKK